MEISGMKAAAIATLCLVAAARCYGTGGDSYEYPATLSDTLDILPGKSLGEIFLETSTIKPPAESWDPAKLRELADRIGKEPVPNRRERPTHPGATHAISLTTFATRSLSRLKIPQRRANTFWNAWIVISTAMSSTHGQNRPLVPSKRTGFTCAAQRDSPVATERNVRSGSIA